MILKVYNLITGVNETKYLLQHKHVSVNVD